MALARRLMLDPSEALFGTRGFAAAADPARQRRLEGIGATFITGFDAALTAGSLADLQAEITAVPEATRGFAFEGAAMGAACADALPLAGTGRLKAVRMAAPQHDYLLHVGAGWAMARVPWLRWTLPPRLDPLLRWLAWDGRGFHDTYFKRVRPESGPRGRGYAAHAFDQGVGRALWFVCGGDMERALRRIAGLPRTRHNALYAGLGLALTYAGGASDGELQHARQRAGPHAPALAQGAAFALEARARAGNRTDEALAAGETLTARKAEAAVRLVRAVRSRIESEADTPALPRYERWRRGVQAGLGDG